MPGRECDKCLEKFSESDFFGTDKYKNWCYKCIYQDKLKLCPKKKGCSICKKALPSYKWRFCSDECAKIGYDKQQKNYWFRRMRRNSTFEKTDWNKT
jgi:predicted nucleic acid-binding Zn ribbon protein